MKCLVYKDTNASIVKMSAETSGLCGGDAGHGGYTEIIIENEASFCTEVLIEYKDDIETYESPDKITLRFLGDSEQSQLKEFIGLLNSYLEENLK